MFNKLFTKTFELKFEYESRDINWAISANENTIVLWHNTDNTKWITTLDRVDDVWIDKNYEIKNSEFNNAGQVYLNEDGTILLFSDYNKQKIITYYRYNQKGKWNYGTCNSLSRIRDKNIAFFNNNIILASQNQIMIIIQRMKTAGFKILRKSRTVFSYFTPCLCFCYSENLLVEINDPKVRFWAYSGTKWYTTLTTLQDVAEELQFHSSCQGNEVKVFAERSLWSIKYPDKETYLLKDERITNTKTQSALNYFFQTKQNKQIGFWYRLTPEVKKFDYEVLQVQANDILLGQNGKVFTLQKQCEQEIIIEIYELK